jgi:hypothetical protein
MRSLFRARMALVIFAVVGASLPILASTAASVTRTDRTSPALSDGRWVGSLQWTGNQVGRPGGGGLQINNAPFAGSGSMQLVVQGDQIEESTFSMVITGSIEGVGNDLTTYTGDRTMSYSGTVGGVPESPCLQGQHDISGTVTANTPLGPLEVSLAPGDAVFVVECSNMPLQLAHVACDVASGTFAPFFADENARHGIRLGQQATFTLFRAGDYFTPEEAEANAAQIQAWVTRLNSEVPENPRALRALLSEIDRFFGDTFRNDECGRLGRGATILADAVRTMTIGYLARHAGNMELGDLAALIQANYRVGNFSFADAGDPLAHRARIELYAALEDQIDFYERAGGRLGSDFLEQIETIARQYGWNGLADRAREAWGRLNDS